MEPETGCEVTHCSDPVEPVRGFVAVHDEPESYQYPVAVVVRTCGDDAPKLFDVKVGGENPKPPPTIPYDNV